MTRCNGRYREILSGPVPVLNKMKGYGTFWVIFSGGAALQRPGWNAATAGRVRTHGGV
jgi:hypothetical protein